MTLYLLLPIYLIYALFLVVNGLPQTLASSLNPMTLDGARQTVILERVVSQEAIKM